MPGLAKRVFLGNDFPFVAIGKSNILPLPVTSLAEFPQLVIKLLIAFAVKRCRNKLSRCVPRAGAELARLRPVSCGVGRVSGLPAGTPVSTARRGLAPAPSRSRAHAVPRGSRAHPRQGVCTAWAGILSMSS